MDDFFEYFMQKFDTKKIKPNEYSPLVLAYIGDAVYEMIIRTMVISEGNRQVNKLHNKSKNYVKASSQAKIVYSIMDYLSEEEINVFKRGRNAKSGSVPKNADISDYRNATGFEALIGYLYLKRDLMRILDLISEGVKG